VTVAKSSVGLQQHRRRRAADPADGGSAVAAFSPLAMTSQARLAANCERPAFVVPYMTAKGFGMY